MMMHHDKFYAVKNDKGEFAHIEMDKLTWETGFATVWLSLNKSYAKRAANDYGGHVVELAEKHAPVVVSEAEAKILTEAKTATYPAEYITRHSYLKQGSEDRLMRAYVIGWTVEKPKRYVLPMHGTEYRSKLMHGNAQYYAIKGTGNWQPDATALGTGDAVKHGYTVTKSEIETAPGWVKTITPVEVTDDEQ